MLFSKAAYSDNKDQLRSLKSRMHLKIGPGIQPRSQTSFSLSSPNSSAVQSECSTLVDFPMGELEEAEEFEDATALGNDNSAWVHDSRSAKTLRQSKPRRLFHSTRSRPTKMINPAGFEPEMLDPEDRAWM
ncbi:hypothetical protein CERSUDRAFT_110854 [Gelatoporia subvermispora B]|uniref:Uncharacterized protein n=1 Tax=Ceriporiopsis subvermispora (strain B) TaxID=914234 RepID=M2RD34_CERS8|nr:hypothetical protein CERSUDRAFT_110854 [Gelatoporia subvermispora B]